MPANIRQFGIFSPVMGLREDIPSVLLPETFTEDNENVLLRDGMLSRAAKPVKELYQNTDVGGGSKLDQASTPDGNPLLYLYWYVKRNGDRRLLGFTKDHVYAWYEQPTIGQALFTGTGLDDMSTGGTYTGTAVKNFRVQIDKGQVSVTAFVDGGSGPPQKVLVTAAGHNLTDGDTVQIGGSPNYNGSYTVSEVSGDTFKIEHSWDGDDSSATTTAERVPNTYKWSNDGGQTWEATEQDITSGWVTLEDGVQIRFFISVIGHDTGDYWDFFAAYAGSWHLKHTCGSSCSNWSVTTYNDKVIATNNVDKVLYWDGSGDFAILDDPTNGIDLGGGSYLTAAKVVQEFEGYLFLANVTVDGTQYPQSVYWCSHLDEENWDGGDSGSLVTPDPYFITAMGRWQDFMFIFKERSIYRLWLGGEFTFTTAAHSTLLGTQAPNSVVNGERGELYFFSSDFHFRMIAGSLGDMPVVSHGIDSYVRDIPDDAVPNIFGHFVYRLGQVEWAVPINNSSTNNVVLTLKDGVWTRQDAAYSCYGRYQRILGYASLCDMPFATVCSIPEDFSFCSSAFAANEPVDMAGDYDGKAWALYHSTTDDGDDYEGYGVLATSLAKPPNLSQFKRILWLHTYFKPTYRPDEDVSIYVSVDQAPYTLVATASTYDQSADVVRVVTACDLRGRHFRFKFLSDKPFNLIGMIAEFIPVGER